MEELKMSKTISLEESEKMNENYEYYTNLKNLEKEIFIPFEDEKINLRVNKINKSKLKEIYYILLDSKKFFKYTGQSYKVTRISNALHYLKKFKKIKETDLLIFSFKNKGNKKLKEYSIDYYTGIIPNRIVKVYHDKYFKYEYFNIIECQNTRYLVGMVYSQSFPFYQLHIILDYWNIEEEVYYKPSLYNSFSFRVRKTIFNTNRIIKEFICELFEY